MALTPEPKKRRSEVQELDSSRKKEPVVDCRSAIGSSHGSAKSIADEQLEGQGLMDTRTSRQDSSTDAAGHLASANKQVKLYYRSLVLHCIKCGKIYDKVDDMRNICVYHDGSLEVDHENWYDHDGPSECLDTIGNRVKNLRQFIWDYCDEEGGWGTECQRWKHPRSLGTLTGYAELEMFR
ncbi:hypothetical protein H2198_000933 [Neophaeococcomyces mojaviensis]|uniref:Uncharacterized protein n=1 Tax=Neophaeococcomyces mojaviensis TaxID=3383035 RepID=A0ACC3AIV1_9EURO|nr:hypothetical protein H2198_000933 [Knufia sp. JES_112]